MIPLGSSTRTALVLCLAAAFFRAGPSAAAELPAQAPSGPLAALDKDGVQLVISIRHPKLLNEDLENLMKAVPEAGALRMALMQASAYGYPEFSDIEPGSAIGVAFVRLLGAEGGATGTDRSFVGFAKLKQGGKIWNLLASNGLALRKNGAWTLVANSQDAIDRIASPQAVIALLEKPHPEDLRVWLRTSPTLIAGVRQEILKGYHAQHPGVSEPNRRELESEIGAAQSLLSQVRALTMDISLGNTGVTIRSSVEAEPDTPAGRLLSAEPGPRPAVADFVSGDSLVTGFQRYNQKALAEYLGYAFDTLTAPLDKARAAAAQDAKETLLATLAAGDGGAAATVDFRIKSEGGQTRVVPEYFAVESGRVDRELERRRVALAAKLARNITRALPVAPGREPVHAEVSILPDAATIDGVPFDRMTSSSRMGTVKLSDSQQYFGVVGGFAVVSTSEETLRARLPALLARRAVPDPIATPVLPGEWMRFTVNGGKLVDHAVAAAKLDPRDADVKAAVGQFKAEYGAGGPVAATMSIGANRAIFSLSIPYSFLEATIHLGVYAHGKGLDAATIMGWFRPYGLAGPGLQPQAASPRPVLSEWVRRSNLAGRLLSQGHYADSLAEYAWCYDHANEGQPAATAFRANQALRGMARVGANYPPALDAIRERRARIEGQLTARPGDPELFTRLVEVNRLLRDKSATLAFFDQLPAGSPARAALLPRLFSQFMEARRYADALKARPYDAFARQFQQLDELKAQEPESNLIGLQTSRIVAQGAMEAEALAGTGDTATARQLVERILKLKDTPLVRTSLRHRLDRVGHGDWISGSAEPAVPPAGR